MYIILLDINLSHSKAAYSGLSFPSYPVQLLEWVPDSKPVDPHESLGAPVAYHALTLQVPQRDHVRKAQSPHGSERTYGHLGAATSMGLVLLTYLFIYVIFYFHLSLSLYIHISYTHAHTLFRHVDVNFGLSYVPESCDSRGHKFDTSLFGRSTAEVERSPTARYMARSNNL